MPFETIFINLDFDELVGLFAFWAILIYFIIVMFNGVMRMFEWAFTDEKKAENIFHHHFHYSDKSKKFAPPRKQK